jgi:hypothetical protein
MPVLFVAASQVVSVFDQSLTLSIELVRSGRCVDNGRWQGRSPMRCGPESPCVSRRRCSSPIALQLQRDQEGVYVCRGCRGHVDRAPAGAAVRPLYIVS